MTSNEDISAVFKDFLMIFFPEKGEDPYFQKNNIVVPRKATKTTKATKTGKIGLYQFRSRISQCDTGE